MDNATVTLHAPQRSQVAGWLDVMQMATGMLLILFLWSHLILVSSVIPTPRLMNAIARFLEATYMAQVGGPMIFLLMFVHFILAGRKMPFRTNEQQTILKHMAMLRHRDTWLWAVQIGTALIILIMASIHMYVVLSDLPITAQKSAARIQFGGWLPFYLVLLPVAELHVGIGFYRIGVKYGLITREKREWYKRAEYIMVAGFVGLGLLALMRFRFLELA
ncbi:succinate dehydrogenase/fumarate reductase cytochrome b subunit [Oleidesulfovibrio sp.]|uniref:succinate dehydrogenase/fumarate reductase cytochrome b subunit n=1 Tax=Oleidesulfovibrio sp. TaxID=2909707 RepID=UPI003A896718